MTSVARSEVLGCSNAKLDLYLRLNGSLVDPYSLEWRVVDHTDTQIYPVAGREAVTIAACPAGQQLGTGHFCASWTVPAGASLSTHRIDWYWHLYNGSAEDTFSEEFEIQSVTGSTSSGYCSVADIRAEGVTDTTTYPDALIESKIILASRLIDKLTGQWFEPRALTLTLDGDQSKRLHMAVPNIDVDEVSILNRGVVTADSYKVYNRHLTQNLTAPDDRQDPRLEFVHQQLTTSDIYQRYPYLEWPRGEQNVTVDGTFGYTDYDAGNAEGVTPLLIERACQLLVFRDLATLCSVDERFDARWRNRVQSMRTRDQSIALGGIRTSGARGYLTGDEEVDSILEHFMAPVAIGRA